MQRFRQTFRAMASQHSIELCCDDPARARDAAQAAIDDVLRIEAKFSRYRDDSVTAAINRGAGGPPVAIDSETAALLRYADQCFARSDGAFDITAGVLRRAWDFRSAIAPRAVAKRRSTRPWRWWTGTRSNGRTSRFGCRAPAWRSISAASARNTRPTARRRSAASAASRTGW